MRLVIRIQVIWWKRFITCLKNLVKKRSVLRWKCCIKNLKTTIRRWILHRSSVISLPKCSFFEFNFVPLQPKAAKFHLNTYFPIMGKLMLLLYFILSVFPADATENRRHIHVVRRGSKKSHRGDTVAKIWIEENGEKKIEVAWSELTADEEALIIETIDKHWDELNRMIDDVFAGKKITIKRIK